jgi:hemoglobin-like flavoprotein
MYDTAEAPERLTLRHIALVQGSWRRVLPIQDLAAELFYRRLFELDRSLERLFHGDMPRQGRKLMTMLTMLVTWLDRLDDIMAAVEELGRAHVGFGVEDAHYDTVGRALLDTLRTGLGDAFDLETEQAWTLTYRTLADVMRRAGS